MSTPIYSFYDIAKRKRIGLRFSGAVEAQDGLKQCEELKYCNQNKAWYLPYKRAVWQKLKANFPDLIVIIGNALSWTEPAPAQCGPKMVHHTGIAGRPACAGMADRLDGNDGRRHLECFLMVEKSFYFRICSGLVMFTELKGKQSFNEKQNGYNIIRKTNGKSQQK